MKNKKIFIVVTKKLLLYKRDIKRKNLYSFYIVIYYKEKLNLKGGYNYDDNNNG